MAPPATPLRPRSDRMKDNILKESSSGWSSKSNAITPLRIAKRDQQSPSSSSSPNLPPNMPSGGSRQVVARRTSNSYKHVYMNNLVSRSPFKSGLAPRQPLTSANTPRTVVPRKVSGEKRPRPNSLVQQAEQENTKRVEELGFRRRQSKGFQSLADLEHVSKSPFKAVTSSEKISSSHSEEEPIAISFPSRIEDENTSPENTETDSSLNSRERPLTPPPGIPAVVAERQMTPSPSFERRSPIPSALQGSPARSSLVQKPRLQGPRARSLSIGALSSPPDTPGRERRKTVTFDERCDVVEFDRESHEESVFESDDEDVYGRPEAGRSHDSTLDFSKDSFEEATRIIREHGNNDHFNPTAFDDSINGLVDSMLHEASSMSEPSTPEKHRFSPRSVAENSDLTTGGAEGGIPLGRTHHADRTRSEIADHDVPLPSLFENSQDDRAVGHPSPRRSVTSDEPHTPRSQRVSDVSPGQHATPVLPPDTECDEEGIPFGRSHHSDRARAARDEDEDMDVEMRPPSPSPRKTTPQRNDSRDLSGMLIPKLDLGIDFAPSPDEKLVSEDTSRDIFGPPEGQMGEFGAEIDEDILSNTSIASFHEFPPQEENNPDSYDLDQEAERSRCSGDVSFSRSIRSLDAIVSDLQRTEEDTCDDNHDPEVGLAAVSGRPEEKMESEEAHNTLDLTMDNSAALSDIHEGSSEESDNPLRSNLGTGFSEPSYGHGSSTVTSDDDALTQDRRSSLSSLPRSPLSLQLKSTTELCPEEVIMLPPTPVEVDHMQLAQSQYRPTLEERLKRALSPTLSAPSPLRNSTSPNGQHPVEEQYTITRTPPSKVTSPVPARLSLHSRAHTYDFDERSSFDRPYAASVPSPMSASYDFSQSGVDIAEMDMRSALERLVDDVSIAGGVEPSPHSVVAIGDKSMATSTEGDTSMGDLSADGPGLLENLTEDEREQSEEPHFEVQSPEYSLGGPSSMDVADLAQPVTGQDSNSEGDCPPPAMNTNITMRSTKTSPGPPPLPPKTPEKSARQAREDMIKEKRRLARARESGEYFVPPRRDAAGKLLEESPAGRRRSSGLTQTRRSLSTGDLNEDGDMAPAQSPGAQRRVSALKHRKGGVLGMTLEGEDLSGCIERELKQKTQKKSYEIVEHERVVYASSRDDQRACLSPSSGSDDKAWRAIRRPSDINEHARQLREIRSREKASNQRGRVFVKVVGIRGLNVPVPPQTTVFTCSLNNGEHTVTTPDCRLSREARIEQEFELIETEDLEFTVTLSVRKDPHILQQFKAIAPPPPPPPPVTPSHRGGVFSFFSSPKKPKVVNPPQMQPYQPAENLARYLANDGALARSLVKFKEMAHLCDCRPFRMRKSLNGQRLQVPGEGGRIGGSLSQIEIGELEFVFFRLPPLPGVPLNKLPQCSDDCINGLIHIKWHKETYYEGILNQLGGDCSTWRRRHMRIIGSSLAVFSEVTRKISTAIDLKRVVSIQDEQDPALAARRKDVDEYDGVYGVERSFKLCFREGDEITFYADTNDEKSRWLNVLRAVVSDIPPDELWASAVWEKMPQSARDEIPDYIPLPPKPPARRRY